MYYIDAYDEARDKAIPVGSACKLELAVQYARKIAKEGVVALVWSKESLWEFKDSACSVSAS